MQTFRHSQEQQRRYLWILVLVVLFLGSVYPFLLQSDFRGTGDLHTITTIFGGILALIAGLALVAHFYSLGDRILLFLGLAYFVGATMDLLRGVMTFGGQHGLFGLASANLDDHTTALYASGRLLMGVILVAASPFAAWMGKKSAHRRQALWVTGVVLLFCAGATALLFRAGTGPALWEPRGLVGRPMDLLLGLLLLVALFGLVGEYRQGRNMLVWWVVLSVGVAAVAHLIGSLSRTPFDASYSLAHAYMTMAYIVPIVGFPLCQIAVSLERRQAMSALQEQRSLFKTVLSNTPDLIALKDSHFIYQAANDAFCEFVGKGEDEVLGKSDFDIFDEGLARKYRRDDEEVLCCGQSRIQDESVEQRGLRKWFHVLRAPVRDAEDNPIAVLSSVRDITDIKRMEHQLRIMSHTDDLTGLHNRRGFFVLAEQLLRTASRNQWSPLLMFIDVDKMKSINDELGHDAGDAALKDVGAVLRQTFRDSDVLARIGGDEFAVMAVDDTGDKESALAERLAANLRVLNETPGRAHSLSLSIGVLAVDPAAETSVDSLLSRADTLMYKEKRTKRAEL